MKFNFSLRGIHLQMQNQNFTETFIPWIPWKTEFHRVCGKCTFHKFIYNKVSTYSMENRIPLCYRWIIDRRHIFRESCGKMNSRKQVSSGTRSFIFRWNHSKIMEKCFLFILLHCNGILFSTIVWSQFSMKFVENVSGILVFN